jgi:hypothetical protein
MGNCRDWRLVFIEQKETKKNEECIFIQVFSVCPSFPSAQYSGLFFWTGSQGFSGLTGSGVNPENPVHPVENNGWFLLNRRKRRERRILL